MEMALGKTVKSHTSSSIYKSCLMVLPYSFSLRVILFFFSPVLKQHVHLFILLQVYSLKKKQYRRQGTLGALSRSLYYFIVQFLAFSSDCPSSISVL